MCTYLPCCFYCYKTSRLFWSPDCSQCTFVGWCCFRVWLHPPTRPFPPLELLFLLCVWPALSRFCLAFGGGVRRLVEGFVLCKQQCRPFDTITGCFDLLHFTTSEGTDLSQLGGRENSLLSVSLRAAPLIALMFCTLRKTRSRNSYSLCVSSQWQSDRALKFLDYFTKNWMLAFSERKKDFRHAFRGPFCVSLHFIRNWFCPFILYTCYFLVPIACTSCHQAKNTLDWRHFYCRSTYKQTSTQSSPELIPNLLSNCFKCQGKTQTHKENK